MIVVTHPAFHSSEPVVFDSLHELGAAMRQAREQPKAVPRQMRHLLHWPSRRRPTDKPAAA